jgi:predicted negative regulator of RcsB-dependent stress response
MSADLKESSIPLAEISQAPNAFEQFLDRNQKSIFVFAILLIIAAIAAVVYRGVEASKAQSAGIALIKADDVPAYQSVIDSNPSSPAAGSAMILLANAQWSSGKKDESIATLRKFIAEYPTHPALYTAKASLGTKLISQGKSGDATTVLEEISTDAPGNYMAPFALISLGDIAKNAGDLEKAESYYSKVQKFPDSNFITTATARLTTLKSKAPTEIEPPPAPPAPPTDAAAPASTPLTITPPSEAPSPEAPVAPQPEP